MCDVLGIIAVKKEEILDKEIEDLIQERQEARKAKNFARADEIRDELLAKGHYSEGYTRRSKMETGLNELKELFGLKDRGSADLLPADTGLYR